MLAAKTENQAQDDDDSDCAIVCMQVPNMQQIRQAVKREQGAASSSASGMAAPVEPAPAEGAAEPAGATAEAAAEPGPAEGAPQPDAAAAAAGQEEAAPARKARQTACETATEEGPRQQAGEGACGPDASQPGGGADVSRTGGGSADGPRPGGGSADGPHPGGGSAAADGSQPGGP